MSLIEQGDIPHRVNQVSVQPEPSPVIHPNKGSQLDTPTLTEKTDKEKSLVPVQAQIHILALISSRNLLLSPTFYR